MAAAPDEAAEAIRLVLALYNATKAPDDATWSWKLPYGFWGNALQMGAPLGLGRVPMKYISFVKVFPEPSSSYMLVTASATGTGEKDGPQFVSFPAHDAATCGFELAYAAIITHFLVTI